ncbi:MAG: hypothetical protein WCN95_12110 [bacterium]
MIQKMNRREFTKSSLLAAAGSAFTLNAVRTANADDKAVPAPKSADAAPLFPQGKIGKLSISRLIMGSNLITFYVHARDLNFVNELTKHYNTDDKIMETLAIAEKNGINTIMTQADDKYLGILKKYRNERGGKLHWIVAPMIAGSTEDFNERVRKLAMEGVDGMYIHGAQGDPLTADGKKDLIARVLEQIKRQDIPAGVGGHDLNTIKYCEDNKIEADFYVKTFHHHNYPSAPKPEDLKGATSEVPGYWCKNPRETADFMKNVKKPWIAFKVMAAGAIPPRSAFTYSYQNGADFILAGMYDFEIAEDVAIARKALDGAAKRDRPWYG